MGRAPTADGSSPCGTGGATWGVATAACSRGATASSPAKRAACGAPAVTGREVTGRTLEAGTAAWPWPHRATGGRPGAGTARSSGAHPRARTGSARARSGAARRQGTPRSGRGRDRATCERTWSRRGRDRLAGGAHGTGSTGRTVCHRSRGRASRRSGRARGGNRRSRCKRGRRRR